MILMATKKLVYSPNIQTPRKTHLSIQELLGVNDEQEKSVNMKEELKE